MITKEERRRISWENAQKCRKPNKYSVIDGVAHVILSNTKNIMLCDVEDWENWKQYTWHENTYNHYVETSIDGKKEKYHYHLAPKRDGMVIDHINHDRHDNRAKNIRLVSKHLNAINTKLSRRNQSGYKGVRKSKSGKWIAYIFFNRKQIHLGTYENIEDAVYARKKAEDKYFHPVYEKEALEQSAFFNIRKAVSEKQQCSKRNCTA